METKRELVDQLAALMPDMAEEIARIVGEYRISRENRKDRRSLQRSVDSFLAAKKIDGLSTKTLKNYREMLGAFSASVDKPAARITTDDIRAYIGQLAARGLRDSSIQTHINTIRSFFAWLDMEELIKRNPMRRIKSLKIDRMAARRPLEPEEMERLRDSCQTYKERALVEFMASSGCRLSEVIGIRIDQVDWKRRSVKVLGKGHKERVVYFSVRACLMLQEYISRRKGGQTLFASSRTPYAPMSPRAVEKALQRIGERAGIARRVHPHILRHTFATAALKGGMDLTIIQRLLGHTDPKTTLIYAELQPEAVRYAYERIVA